MSRLNRYRLVSSGHVLAEDKTPFLIGLHYKRAVERSSRSARRNLSIAVKKLANDGKWYKLPIGNEWRAFEMGRRM